MADKKYYFVPYQGYLDNGKQLFDLKHPNLYSNQCVFDSIYTCQAEAMRLIISTTTNSLEDAANTYYRDSHALVVVELSENVDGKQVHKPVLLVRLSDPKDVDGKLCLGMFYLAEDTAEEYALVLDELISIPKRVET